MLRQAGILCGIALLAMPAWGTPTTVERIRSAGALRCGVPSTPEDWNKVDLHGPLAALDLEICKALSVAVLGAKAKVEAHGYASELEAEQGLARGEVEVAVGVTPEATARWHWHIAFGPPVFYDGQGFLVRADAKAKSVTDLVNALVCVVDGTENEKVLHARTVARGIALIPLVFQEEGEMDDALAVRHCDAISAYESRLYALKATYGKQLGQDTVLPGQLTLSPIAPAYRTDDVQWAMVVDWTIYALIQAEASGLTAANVRDHATSEDPMIQRLTGIDWATSRALGLPARDWAAQVIAVTGNYGEIYDRTVGLGSSLKIPRGINALWTEGGLMHPLPVQ